MRINKREENMSHLRLLSPASKRRMLRDRTREYFSSQSLSGLSLQAPKETLKESSKPTDRGQPSITYDEQGNQMEIVAPNTDKLPNLMGNLAYFQQPITEESEHDTVNILKNRSRVMKRAAGKTTSHQRRKNEL